MHCLIERGECSFVSKAIKAAEAGAVAAIITDNDTENDELYVAMQGRIARCLKLQQTMFTSCGKI